MEDDAFSKFVFFYLPFYFLMNLIWKSFLQLAIVYLTLLNLYTFGWTSTFWSHFSLFYRLPSYCICWWVAWGGSCHSRFKPCHPKYHPKPNLKSLSLLNSNAVHEIPLKIVLKISSSSWFRSNKNYSISVSHWLCVRPIRRLQTFCLSAISPSNQCWYTVGTTWPIL